MSRGSQAAAANAPGSDARAEQQKADGQEESGKAEG